MSRPHHRTSLATALLAAAAALAGAPAALAAGQEQPEQAPPATPAMPAPDDQAMIASAMTAAPKTVGEGATIVTSQPDGSMRTLREGNNGFTCMPDNPATPGPDAMCMDANALAWAGSWIAHTDPAPGKLGFMYMLAGGTDASNTDPYATSPDAGNHWIKTGPHVMIVGADQGFYDQYPKDEDPDTSAPYVMWVGTPYQHLMIPVR